MIVERFKKIFEGQDCGYGQSKPTGEIREDGKVETKNAILRLDVTHQHWEDHLNGKGHRFGVIPIKSDNTCKWGCIDVDVYDLDHIALIKKIKELKLPLIYFRSKSNGAHIFLFVEDFVPAKAMINRLREMAAQIGHAGREIYPKQEEVIVERGDMGSYLNAPYFNYKNPDQCMLNDEGKEMPIEDFFEVYGQKVLSVEAFTALGGGNGKEKDERLKGMPPCLVTLLKNKLGKGLRNDTFSNLAIYCKKRYGDQWENKLADYNCDDFMEEKLELNELNGIIKSVGKKEYRYGCKKEPLYGHCRAEICVKREFGVGDELPMPEITQVRKFNSDPPMYFIDIDGKTVFAESSKDVLNFKTFQALAFDQINDPLDYVQEKFWIKLVRKKVLENQDNLIMEAPDELKKEYKMKESMRLFIKARKDDKPELVPKGKVYTDNGKTYFKLKSFHSYYNTSRQEKTKHHLFARDVQTILGADSKSELKVKMKTGEEKRLTVWSVPEMDLEEIAIDKKEKKKAAFEQ